MREVVKIKKGEGLTASEAAFIDRMRTISHWIARGLTNAELIARIQDQFQSPSGGRMRSYQARDWIIKAREYIAGTIEADIETARLYRARLEDFMDRCQKHLVTDIEEVTIVGDTDSFDDQTEPAAGGDGAKKPTGKRYRRRVRKQVMNAGIGNLLFKVMREHAIITGARPKDGPKTINNQQVNNTVNVAAGVAQAAPTELLRMMGGETQFEVVEEAPGPGSVVPGEAADSEGAWGREVSGGLQGGAGSAAEPNAPEGTGDAGG